MMPGEAVNVRTTLKGGLSAAALLPWAALALLFMLAGGCGDEPSGPGGATAPTVVTGTVTDIAQTVAQVAGTVTDDGGATVTSRGICWSTDLLPDLSDSTATAGQGTGAFAALLTGLDPDTRYRARAFATNSAGTAYGDTVSFRTLPTAIMDVDGNLYHAVAIGTQVWMLENLKTTHFADGTPIDNVDTDNWLNYPFAAYCDYFDDPTWSQTYGRLYNWAAVVDPKGLAPDGWRVANDYDWQLLEQFLGMSTADADLEGWRGTDQGGQLKEAGTSHWQIPNTGATNASGFTALPGGRRDAGGHHSSIQLGAWIWTSTITTGQETDAWTRWIAYDHADVFRAHWPKGTGLSVRCIKESK